MSQRPITLPEQLADAVLQRFGEPLSLPPDLPGADELLRMLMHSSHRKWADQVVSADLLQLLFACALSAPSKSDLQQADIVHVAERARIKAIADWIPDMPWINALRTNFPNAFSASAYVFLQE
jgi:nitroreductase/FMN reductase [NAD(P)H]